MNDICLGCGDEMMPYLMKGIICEICWRGEKWS